MHLFKHMFWMRLLNTSIWFESHFIIPKIKMAIPNSHIDYRHIFNIVDWHFNVSQWQHHKSVATSRHLSKHESNYIQTHNNNTTYCFIFGLLLCGVWFGTLFFLFSVIVAGCFSYYYLLVCIFICIIYAWLTVTVLLLIYNCFCIIVGLQWLITVTMAAHYISLSLYI